MNEKFNFSLKAGKIDIEELERFLAKKNEKIREIARVRSLLLDSTMELSEEETDIAIAIIEIGADIVTNNQ